MKKLMLLLFLCVALNAQNEAAKKGDIPHLKRQGSTFQLIVNGEPF